MSEIAISAVGLSKRYRLGRHRRDATLRDVLVDAMCAPFRGLRSCLGGRGATETGREPNDFIWALKSVSFEVRRGDVIGIIGRNGAGKSTLLKVLSRITEPSKGYAEIHGRVGSLLEVGTGFHPELTGRDNIYLNGAILGIRKTAIDRKFDEIVTFAEIEKFLDTPVKHYSSGMYMRLAFAVAAHLEPDILLVDEVLAVGDAAFQKKCLGRIGDVAKEGRTVLFVSHNLPAVQRLCSTAYLLEQGRIVLCSDAVTVVDAYYRSTASDDDSVLASREVPDGAVGFVSWEVAHSSVNPHSCHTGGPCTIRLRLIARRSVRKANFGIALWADDGTLVWAMRSLDHGGECVGLREGAYQLEFAISELPLRPGAYQILVSANDSEEGTLDSWYAQPKLVIVPRNDSGLPPPWQGVLNLSGKFNLWPVGVPGREVTHNE